MTSDRIIDDTVQSWTRQRPDLDLRGMDAFLRLGAIVRAGAQAVADDMADLGVTIPEFDVLATLRRHGDGALLTPGYIAHVAMVKPSGLSHRLARLERIGLITRQLDPDDRRSLLVTLTPSGRVVADRGIEILAAEHTSLFSGLSDDQRAMLVDAADTVLRRRPAADLTPR